MCGICGFITNHQIGKDALIKMNRTLAHRGPDDHGEEIYQMNAGSCIGMAQRRLSIIDLSPNGHQPMHSVDGRITVVFNGEIYNFQELKEKLSNYPFQSDCDTEVIIAAYLKWGIRFVDKINGMFAIAIYDRFDHSLYLVRDRMGKKPLYYYVKDSQNIVFASELKAILECPFFKKEINKDIIGRFLYRRCIIAPDTIYKNTYKLEMGSILKIQGGIIEKNKYWDVAKKYNELREQLVCDYDQAKYELKNLLKKAVAKRMVADVPVGAFLSGGYDSSLVCAIAQEMQSNPLKTFSIGFYESEYNEAVYAKEIAKYLGTEHEELYITEKEMLGLLEELPSCFDEPLADSSQIPTMLVSKLAKRDVSVVLSGDGGDELFGGYDIYPVLQQAQKKRIWGKAVHYIRKFPGLSDLPRWQRMNIVERIVSDDLNKEAKTQTGVKTYIDAVNNLLLSKADNFYYEFESRYKEKRYEIRRMLLDLDTFLTDDILAKVDRASMNYALECRCPILDTAIVEYSFQIPSEYKISDDRKKILKDITHDYLPKQLMDRPKNGFVIPLDRWLRGALKERMLEWTEKSFLEEQGIFNPEITKEFVIAYLQEGDKGKFSGKNFSRICWSYFIFQQWYNAYF